MTLNLTPFLAAILAMGLIPLFAVVATSFTKIVIVLMIVRNAIGIQQLPPNIIVYSIAMVLSIHIMGPVIEQTLAKFDAGFAVMSSLDGLVKSLNAASGPWTEFLRARSTESTRSVFESLLREPAASLTPLQYIGYVLCPAFMADEMTRAFQIGLMLYIPFVAIDLVIGTILVAIGMQTLSPTVISAPVKLLLFIAVEGWTKLFSNMLLSYQ
jgi:type III secretion protein R